MRIYPTILSQRVAGVAVAAVLSGCAMRPASPEIPAVDMPLADMLTEARAPNGAFISWREHLIDAEDVNGGVAIRGGDGLVIGDLDRDGFPDIISVHEDSGHIRIAFGGQDPREWTLVTLTHGAGAAAVEDVAIGDLNQDGWLDIIAACEDAHLIYFENPGTDIRTTQWDSIIPEITQNRGSWLRVFMADMNGDGALDITAANKGAADIIDPAVADGIASSTSLFLIDGTPLEQASWREQILLRKGIANTAMPVDIDGDGDLDVLAASRNEEVMFLLENNATLPDETLEITEHKIQIKAGFEPPEGWRGLANAFQSEFADLDGDGRLDLVVNAHEAAPGMLPHFGLVWLQQPASLDDPWTLNRIGHVMPDWIAGIRMADIDSDGDLDVVAGGYSGLNILAGAYSGAPRLQDDPGAIASDTVGRIAWFENPGHPNTDKEWRRHDISRRVRDMNDAFVPIDLDSDGDLDLVSTRGNSGDLDGVFWLEQVRSQEARPNFTAARETDSRQLPPPPEDWPATYRQDRTFKPASNTE
ncbi:MAG: VCBS repeat-containing protein [Hyphomonas sp.]